MKQFPTQEKKNKTPSLATGMSLIRSQFQVLLEERGGYRFLTRKGAQKLLSAMEWLDPYTLDLWHDQQLCKAIVCPSRRYHFWDMASDLYGEPTLEKQTTLNIVDHQGLSFEVRVTNPPDGATLGIFSIRYAQTLKEGKIILGYTWTVSCTLQDTPPGHWVCGTVGSTRELVGLLHRWIWKMRMFRVIQQYKMTPLYVTQSLVHNDVPVDTWIKELDQFPRFLVS